jgi:hypothetical protein
MHVITKYFVSEIMLLLYRVKSILMFPREQEYVNFRLNYFETEINFLQNYF